MRVALFTSNHLRHKYIANQLARSVDLQLILTEEKSPAIEDAAAYDEEDKTLLKTHFNTRQRSESEFFGMFSSFPETVTHIALAHGKINTEKTLHLLQAHRIDWILLFGTSIIKPVLLNAFPNRMVNLHLGLSPYYKGSGTNFFPVVHNEFECIGGTIHIATSKVDAGAILCQFRPDVVSETDNLHSLGNKVIEKAGRIYGEVLKAYASDKLKGILQQPNTEAKIFRLKDFTPEALRKAHAVLLNGGIKKYLKEKEKRIGSKPIVNERT